MLAAQVVVQQDVLDGQREVVQLVLVSAHVVLVVIELVVHIVIVHVLIWV